MARKHNLGDLLYQGKQLIEFYREHPCTAAYELLGVDLAPIQRLVFRDMWFKNYVIAVCGRGLGKSQYIGSLTYFNNKGLVYLNEVLPPVPTYLRDGEEEIIGWDSEVFTSEGYRPIKRLCLEKGIEGKFIKTHNGFENRGSNHHPLLVLNENCEFTYKSLDEFIPGDRICIQRDQQTFGNSSIPEDVSYLIGLFLGDGSIGKGYQPCITSEDDYIKNFCIEYCIANNIGYRKDDDLRTVNTSKIYFKKFNYFFEKYQIERVLSYDKSVPYSIRTATRESQIAFLQGYFDTDGTVDVNSGGVSCCSVSKKLVSEVQIMLLNFGVISRIRKKKTKSKFGKAYILDIFSEDAYKFKELIGFRLDRKQSLLENYFLNKSINVNKDTIPYVKELCWKIRQEFLNSNCKKYNDPIGKLLPFKKSNKEEITYSELSKFVSNLNKVITLGYKVDINKFKLLRDILKYHYYFDAIEFVEDWKGNCYDFEMNMDEDIEPNYFTNGFINHNTFMDGVLATLSALLYPGYRVGLIGPVFRQSKLIFAEIEKLYDASSILREATSKKPTRGSDTCYLRFKSVAGRPGSYIEALPLGDGNKIRGSRFYLIIVDELAQVPDQTLDMVVRPMGATSLAPMERVRRIEEQERLIKAGLATLEDFEEEKVNKMIMTSSGYYKFNHMWRRMKDHWRMVDEAEKKGLDCPYAVWQVPYWDLPKGFSDKANIDEAKRIMTRHEFSMEYEAAMVSDSEGFFKASLLEQCSLGSGHDIEIRGHKGSDYVIGVDPNQGGAASTGIVIVRLGTANRIVNVLELKRKTTQELTNSIQEICEKFNVTRIFMDKGGGGKAICDLLEDGYGGYEPIIDRANEDHIHLSGRHILELVNFNPSWIADANFTTKAMLESKNLLFPETPIDTSDLVGKTYEKIESLKSQMLSIIVTQTTTGMLHFDTPSKSMNKDLYSALILAAHGARIIGKELEDDGEPILYNSGGLIRMHNHSSSSFDNLHNNGNPVNGYNPISAAVLHKKNR
jgi:hypothetical protein